MDPPASGSPQHCCHQWCYWFLFVGHVASVEQPKTKTVFSPPQLLLPLSAEKENTANQLPGTGHDTIGGF